MFLLACYVILCNRQGANVAREAKKWEKLELTTVSGHFSLLGALGVLESWRFISFPGKPSCLTRCLIEWSDGTSTLPARALRETGPAPESASRIAALQHRQSSQGKIPFGYRETPWNCTSLTSHDRLNNRDLDSLRSRLARHRQESDLQSSYGAPWRR